MRNTVKNLLVKIPALLGALLLSVLAACPKPEGNNYGHFTVDPVLTFEAGVNEGEIAYSWTDADGARKPVYTLYVVSGKFDTAKNIVKDENCYDSAVKARNGTFKGDKDEWYSAVLRTVDGSKRADSQIAQVKSRGTISLGDDYDLRFGVISDTHVGGGRGFFTYPLYERLAKVVKWYSTQPGVKFLEVNGDITETGAPELFDKFMDTWNENKGSLQLIANLGNHDGNYEKNSDVTGNTGTAALNAFESTTGLKSNAHYVIDGYHFITLSGGSGDFINTGAAAGAIDSGYLTLPNETSGVPQSSKDWLRGRIDYAKATAAGKPIFIFLHWPIRNTHYVSDESYTGSFGSDPLTGWFKDDKEVVIFGGHIHSPNNDPRSIWQGGFSSVNVPSINYMEMEKGYLGDTGNSVSPESKTYPKTANIATGQGLIVSVKGSKVTIANYDFDLCKGQRDPKGIIRIPQTWEFDVTKEFPYTAAKRDTQKTAPVFDPYSAPDAAISGGITLISAKITNFEVEFTQARMPLSNPGNEIVHSYRFDFINKADNTVERSMKQWSDFMVTPRLQKTIYTQIIGGLTANREYELRIFAYGSFQECSTQYLTASFKTAP
jgi:hypothetical protein